MTLKSGTILALAFASISMTAVAADPMTPKAGMTPMEHHQSMDTNKDGMLSKEEFMTHHDQMRADMNKDLVLLRCPDRLRPPADQLLDRCQCPSHQDRARDHPAGGH